MAGTREIAQRNGLKGGRPVGSKSVPQDIKRAAKEAVENFYREYALDGAKEMKRIALQGKFEPTRVQAIDRMHDRIFGKPPQPHDGDGLGGSIILQVYTGVPEPDDDD